MPDLAVDTDVLIEHLRGNERIRSELRRVRGEGRGVLCTPIAAAEIYHGMRAGEERATEQLFAVLRCAPITQAAGEQAGRYLARYHRSHGLGLGDALVAAVARVRGAALFTLNLKHYPMTDIRIHRLRPSA